MAKFYSCKKSKLKRNWENSGDISVLCETSEDGEGWGETLVRGIKEELGVDYIYQPTLFSIGKRWLPRRDYICRRGTG